MKNQLTPPTDFIPNHTSNLHQWFIDSEDNKPGFEDYYIWADGIENGTPQKSPPNNWM